jgi:hypothetical protein
MKTPEIMFNLWYVHGGDGFIYSLRVRAYVGTGTEEENLALLRKFASLDYLIARPFTIPARSHVIEKVIGGEEKRLPIASTLALKVDSPIALFEEAILEMEKAFPAQSKIKVSECPLVCITPLAGDEDGNIKPEFQTSAELGKAQPKRERAP